MTILTDGCKTVSIKMQTWRAADGQYDIDWSADFFEVGCCQLVGHIDTDEYPAQPVYKVKDVDYCIDYAREWARATGDFSADEDAYKEEIAKGDERVVTVDEFNIKAITTIEEDETDD